MALDDDQIGAAAEALAAAERDRAPIRPLTEAFAGIDVDDAYAVQQRNVERRLRDGAQVHGHKVGLTAKAMQEMLGVHEPDYGHLLDDMVVPDGGDTPADRYCAPRVEIEVGFWLARSLSGPNCTVAEVVAATERVVPSIEIIDSRIADWKIALADTIADNASAAGVVAGGPGAAPTEVDLTAIPAELARNGEVVERGDSSAVLGNPAEAVAWLANKLHPYGVVLEPGHLVLPGSCTRAVDVAAGDEITATFAGLGSVSVRFT